MEFPIDVSEYKPLTFKLDQHRLDDNQLAQLKTNIQLFRDIVVFITANSNAKGLGGHTGRPYDVAPEAVIVDGFKRGEPETIYPIVYDAAGHGVAWLYVLSSLNGQIPLEDLLHHREYGYNLPGHPERGFRESVDYSGGRLGHLESYVNGIALANPDKQIVVFSSDASLMEGNTAEAARSAVAKGLKVNWLVDDNDMTICGQPSKYMRGFNIERTLKGYGFYVDTAEAEDITSLYARIRDALLIDRPVGLVNQRKMAPGIEGIEGSSKGHDAIPVDIAIDYLSERGHVEAVKLLQNYKKSDFITRYLGCSKEFVNVRDVFGEAVCEKLKEKTKDERENVRVIGSDLDGSCGLKIIEEKFPKYFIKGGIMERNNYSTLAGFASEPGKQAIFGTFSAFLEMIISEITMAWLNNANVLAHLSHAGVRNIADNTGHFGDNIFYADNELPENSTTRLYAPADANQMRAIVKRVFDDPGLRFVFSTRAPLPYIMYEGEYRYDLNRYEFKPDKDEVIKEGEYGVIVSYADMLAPSLHVAKKLTREGQDWAVINKPTLNTVDENMIEKIGHASRIVVIESQNEKTGLGIRFGTWLLERGFTPKYKHIGVVRHGKGGLHEQIYHQGLGVKTLRNILKKF